MEAPLRLRSLYRLLLRNLRPNPASPYIEPNAVQPKTIFETNASLRQHLRTIVSSPSESSSKSYMAQIADLDQFTKYIAAQKEYIRLIERYNPGLNMAEEDRVRLTARRVGMDLPEELKLKSHQ